MTDDEGMDLEDAKVSKEGLLGTQQEMAEVNAAQAVEAEEIDEVTSMFEQVDVSDACKCWGSEQD